MKTLALLGLILIGIIIYLAFIILLAKLLERGEKDVSSEDKDKI